MDISKRMLIVKTKPLFFRFLFGKDEEVSRLNCKKILPKCSHL